MNQRIVLSLCSCFLSFIGFCKSKVTRKFFNCFLNPLLSTQCWLSQDTSCLPCTPAFSWVSFPETALLHLRWDIPLTSRVSQAALGGERSTHFDAGQSGRCLKPPGAPVVWISLAGPEFRGPWSPQGWLMALRAARPLSTPSSSLRAGLSGWSHGLRGPVLRTCCWAFSAVSVGQWLIPALCNVFVSVQLPITSTLSSFVLVQLLASDILMSLDTIVSKDWKTP